MHQALYRKWRPSDFNQVCGQEQVTDVLKYECQNNKFSHAYLFCGSRGTGKTTCAKILAKAVNCENLQDGSPCGKCASCLAIENGTTTDVLEMDAASNNSVDNIRDIRDEVVYAPSMLKYRVYIIDEVHMLSNSAFNALLKTLEEPPAHVVFILATTELNKLPATIISRCQRFEFRRIALPVITDRLMQISEAEQIDIDRGAAQLLAKLAQGGMRDAVSLLELCAGSNQRITVQSVTDTVGISGRESLARVVRAIAEKDFDVLFAEIAEVVASSKNITVFWQDILGFYRDMLVVKTTSDAAKYLDLTENEMEQTVKTAALFTKETLISHCKLLDSSLAAMLRNGSTARLCAEMTLVRMCDETLDTSSESILSRLSVLEDKVAAGQYAPAREPVVNTPKAADKHEFNSETNAGKPGIGKTAEVNMQQAAGNKAPLAKKRSLPYWAEAVEKISRDDPSVSGFLKSSKIYKNESGAIVLRLDSEFAAVFIKARMQSSIAPVISAFEKRQIAASEIICEVSHENDIIDTGRDGIEEILSDIETKTE